MGTGTNFKGSSSEGISSGLVAGKRNILDPMNLFQLLARRWLSVLLLAVAGGVLGFIYIQYAPRIYKAEAELEMNVRRPKVINSDAVYEDRSMMRDESIVFNTHFTKFKSPAMERLATAEYFKRYPEDEVSSGGKIGKYMLSSLIRDVVWYKDSSANIVYVSYSSTDPEFAAKLVNVLTHCAGLLMMQENQAISDEAVKWLISQADEQRDELGEVEQKLAVLREDLQLDSLSQRKTTLNQTTILVSAEKEALVSKLEARKTVHRFVMELKDTDQNLEMLPTGLPKEERLNELIHTWRQAKEGLEQVAGHYTELHPEYRKAAKVEARAKEGLEQFIEMSSKAVQNEVDLLGKQLAQINQRLAAMERESIDLGQKVANGKQQLQRLEHQRDAADNIYQSMLRRMEEARLSADENMAFTKIIRIAEIPRIPESPSRSRVLITSVFLGIFVGCVLIILFSLGMDKIESVTDLKALGLHILGTIPTYKRVETRGELATIGLHDKFCHMIEIFAGVNALISSKKYDEKARVILMNSAMSGEGKTVASCNLAITSAMNGAKTLLIDGDLRRPQQSNIFSISEEHPSLLEWLMDDDSKLNHQALVSHGVVENLDVITSRPIKEANPAELLGRGRLAELLNWARLEYDRIIIDSPPLGAVGDAQVLANLADAVIIVSRVGKTRRRALRFSLSKFEEIDAFVFGCIANDVPHSISGMFKGAEGYGYSAGYGSYKPYGSE